MFKLLRIYSKVKYKLKMKFLSLYLSALLLKIEYLVNKNDKTIVLYAKIFKIYLRDTKARSII